MLNPATQTLRLSNYDYSTTGGYFITIRFQSPVGGMEHLRAVIGDALAALAKRVLALIPDEWIVMADHFHFIFLLDNSSSDAMKFSVGEAVRSIKARTTRCMHLAGFRDYRWQPNYYDRIIRDEKELNKFRAYIQTNPLADALKKGGVDG